MPRDVSGASSGGDRVRSAIRGVVTAASCFCLYLLFVGSAGMAEAALGVVCAGLTTLWARRMHEDGGTTLRLERSMQRPLRAALVRLPVETFRVGRELIRACVRGRPGGIVEVHPAAAFVTRPLSDPRAQGERALAVLAASLAPDSYVLRLDAARAELVTHAFAPAPRPGSAT